VEEGEFVEGKKHGYCRVIDGSHDNTVNFGIFEDDVPNGHWASYKVHFPEGKFVSYDIDKTFD